MNYLNKTMFFFAFIPTCVLSMDSQTIPKKSISIVHLVHQRRAGELSPQQFCKQVSEQVRDLELQRQINSFEPQLRAAEAAQNIKLIRKYKTKIAQKRHNFN